MENKNEKLEKAIVVLRKFISSQNIDIDLDDKEEELFARYCILKQSCTNDLLKQIGITPNKYDSYFNKNSEEGSKRIQLRMEIQKVYKRLTKERESGFGSFTNFLEWWSSEKKECFYCGVDEKTSKECFDKKIITSKKPAFSGELQIERLDPKAGYNKNNCVFACTLCNNAKSDMISNNDFKEYVAQGLTKLWDNLKKKI